MPTFTFTHEIEYTDWRGHDRVCDAEFRYTYDGVGLPDCTGVVALSDDSEATYAADEQVDDLIADRCESDFAEWLADRDAFVAELAA